MLGKQEGEREERGNIETQRLVVFIKTAYKG